MARDNKDCRGKLLQPFSTIRQRKTTRNITKAVGNWRISAPVATTDRLGSRGYSALINSDMNLSPVTTGSLCNAEMIVEHLRPQLEVTTKDIEPVIIMGLFHYRNLIGSREAFMKVV